MCAGGKNRASKSPYSATSAAWIVRARRDVRCPSWTTRRFACWRRIYARVWRCGASVATRRSPRPKTIKIRPIFTDRRGAHGGGVLSNRVAYGGGALRCRRSRILSKRFRKFLFALSFQSLTRGKECVIIIVPWKTDANPDSGQIFFDHPVRGVKAIRTAGSTAAWQPRLPY